MKYFNALDQVNSGCLTILLPDKNAGSFEAFLKFFPKRAFSKVLFGVFTG